MMLLTSNPCGQASQSCRHILPFLIKMNLVRMASVTFQFVTTYSDVLQIERYNASLECMIRGFQG